MRYYRFNKQCGVFVCSFLILSLAAYIVPATAQNVRVAQRSEDAGESSTDDPADTGELTEYPQTREDETTNVLSPAEQAEALERRAGEEVADDPTSRAIILGMHVQEGDTGRVKVVDVAAASPAFDAGVREGDEIVSFDGLKAKSYREWIDGIRKLVTDTPDGEVVTVDVMRGGKRITARIRTPEERADDPRLPRLLGQQLPDEGQQVQSGGVTGNQPFGPGVISDNDVFINGGGFFGDEFAHGTTERAMAQIFRLALQQAVPLNQQNQQNPTAQPSVAANARRQTSAAGGTQRAPVAPGSPNLGAGQGGRIGLAGFRDDQTGMVVMLDVGGLAPGSYPVGIEDAGLILGGQRPLRNAQNNLGAPTGDVPARDRTNRINRRTNNEAIRNLNNRPGTVPAPAPAPRRQPRVAPDAVNDSQSRSAPEEAGLIPATVLAQVTDENSGSGAATPPTGQAQPNLTPATGEVNPNLTPATGEVNPNRTPPTGQVLPPGAPPTGRVLPSDTPPTGLVDPDAAQNNLSGDIVGGNGLSGSVPSQIGLLTIDQSGTGRLQQVVEGARVRDVVGMAIVIYAPSAPAETTVPPNTNVSGTRGETSAVPGQPPSANDVQPASAPRQLPGGTPPQIADTGPLAGSPTPVAAGIIRLMSDRRPNQTPSGTTGDQNQSIQDQSSGEPANTPVVPATPLEQ
jgi:hypothetical protein